MSNMMSRLRNERYVATPSDGDNALLDSALVTRYSRALYESNALTEEWLASQRITF